MDYEQQQYIENILIDLLSYEESLEFKSDQDKIYINAKIDHLINILNMIIDVISSNEYEYNMILNWTREKYEYYKLQQAKKRLSLFKFENVLRHEPGVFKNIAKHYSNLPVQKSVLNKNDSDLDMDLDSNDLDDIYNTLEGGAKRKREKSKSIDSEPSDPDLELITRQRRDSAARYIQNIMRARLKADKRRKFTKRKFGTHKRPTTHRESNRRFLDHQKYLSKIGDLDEYRANMRQHYFSEGPTNRYINPEYDYYGDMDDYNSNHLRDRLREISMDDLYNDLFE
tara:strand:- start:154 stop:1005 length:852 start_codon:yes stop_codon:yes gene_type:complete